MSRRLPKLTGTELVRALEKAGFVIARTRGSHRFLQHPDGRSTVFPVHARETIGSGLMGKILRDCEITKEEFRALLKTA